LYYDRQPAHGLVLQDRADAGLNGRSIGYARGKVLGGCSSINAMVYMRGQKATTITGPLWGNGGWSWDEVLQCSNAARTTPTALTSSTGVGRRDACRGAAGELGDPGCVAGDAAEECGIPKIAEFNRGDNFATLTSR